jgi:hypothetical protein
MKINYKKLAILAAAGSFFLTGCNSGSNSNIGDGNGKSVTDAASVPVYPSGIGSYANGTIVKGSDGQYYECTVAGWCNQSIAVYVPGSGSAWQSAWELYTGPLPTPSTTPTPNPSASPLPTPAPISYTGTVAGWPNIIAMGAIGGPNITLPTASSTGGNDDFGGRPVDVVFKYAGVNGNGDPGVMDPPTNALSMTNDLNALSAINGHASRVAIVEYTSQMSGGENFSDFSNTTAGASSSEADASYIMARHFISLGSDAIAMANDPVSYNGQKFYGSLIMNPDLLGAIQQNGYIGAVNNALPAGAVNAAVDQALCFLGNSRIYTNTFNPNGASSATYLNKTYTGNPVQILMAMLNDGYPVWSINGSADQYWNSGMSNPASQTESWFNSCVNNPTYNTSTYKRPNFPAGFEGWVQANNWLIRTFATKGTVTFGWQDNMWAIGSGFWLHNDLSTSQIASTYSTPVSSWLSSNAPSAITSGALGNSYAPDYFLFDRYEMDDSAAPGSATLYNARAWDNYLTAVGQVSSSFNNIPIMLWQIPGSHLPYTGEANPELYNGTAGSYVFSTAADYFFGDSNLKSDLSNLIMGASSSSNANTSVGNFAMSCASSAYNCPAGSTYQQFLLNYQGVANNYDWGKDNGKLTLAAKNHVFAILWGGGNTTNVIKNFSNSDDHGWLANKLIAYYANPTYLSSGVSKHTKR